MPYTLLAGTAPELSFAVNLTNAICSVKRKEISATASIEPHLDLKDKMENTLQRYAVQGAAQSNNSGSAGDICIIQ